MAEWQQKVGYLPPLIDLLSYDLHCEGRAPANAVAEAIRTLRPVAKKGRTSEGSKVPYRTQHAAQEALADYEIEKGERTERPLKDAALEQQLVALLEEATDSRSLPNLVNKPGKTNWVEKAGGLPSYIERVAKHLVSEKGYSESRAIATAVNWVKKTCATGRTFGGKTKVNEKARAMACNAVKQWESKKARSRATKEAAQGSAGLMRAVDRLMFMVQPIPDQRSFSTRYANRLTAIEGVLGALRNRFPLAIQQATQILEASEDTPVEDLIVRLTEHKARTMILMEALGYGLKPVRARTDEKHKGRFHGMHGTQRAVRKRDLIPSEEHEPLVLPERQQPEQTPTEKLIAEAAPALAATPTSAQFEQLHPRAQAGKFGQKPGEGAPGAGGGLADEIRKADPQFKQAYGETEKFVETHPGALKHTPSGAAARRSHIDMASAQVQSIGYADTPEGLAQFQKDNGMPVTGRLDPDTMASIQNVYRQNVSRVLKVVDFTGIKGSGAKVAKRTREAKSLNEAFEGLTEYDSIPTGWHHANTAPWEGGTRQPGGDDFNFDEPGSPPPNLREHEGTMACATCVHFAKKITVREGTITGCANYSFPVSRLDVCDSWLTLTPPDATLKVQEHRLAEAVGAGDVDEIVVARAVVRTLRAQNGGLMPMPHPADRDLAVALEEHGAWNSAAMEAVLTAKRRRSLPKGAFAIPPDKYPIHDERHARNALSRVAQHGSEEEKKKVRAAVKRRYPHIGSDS